MTRPLSIAIIVSLLFTSVVMADDKLSPVVKKILDKAVVEVKKNRQEFDKANEKPISEARQELQDLSTKLIKDGKTDEATAVLGQVKTLEADVMKMANASNGGGKAVLQKPLLERMAGRWSRLGEGYFYHLHADGTAETVDQSTNRVTNRVRMAVVSAEVAEAVWPNGYRDRFVLAGDDLIAVMNWNPRGKRDGAGFVLERIK
jgi:hypothetical protein